MHAVSLTEYGNGVNNQYLISNAHMLNADVHAYHWGEQALYFTQSTKTATPHGLKVQLWTNKYLRGLITCRSRVVVGLVKPSTLLYVRCESVCSYPRVDRTLCIRVLQRRVSKKVLGLHYTGTLTH